ncbi:DnaJ-like protein subfamily A member 3 [Colletotrichum sidae]|uniref:DnaJ-like protein subfamily A member 3 n=1 Tax=Colletotrichum sidae TaxID=1347389 RepID=A0A4R8TPR7_9PEZI|nr:DnaJ-like protein subfamily A member 3 [Colletotrichum sidae]
MLLRRLQPAAARPLRSGALPLPPPSPSRHHNVSARLFHTTRPLLSPPSNHYETLKVPPNASPAEIKKSFYALSKAHHPDHNPNDPSATTKFHAISEAYSILGTPAKRAAYDASLPSSSSSSSSAASRRGSYHSTGPAGGRPASGLSRRRTTVRGPPPSFYRSGGWGTQSAKRKAAQEGDYGAATGEPSRPGMGPGQDPYGHTKHGNVGHFDSHGHTKTQEKQDSRRAVRIMGQEVTVGAQETSVGAFLVVSGVLLCTFFIPYLLLVGPKKKPKEKHA